MWPLEEFKENSFHCIFYQTTYKIAARQWVGNQLRKRKLIHPFILSCFVVYFVMHFWTHRPYWSHRTQPYVPNIVCDMLLLYWWSQLIYMCESFKMTIWIYISKSWRVSQVQHPTSTNDLQQHQVLDIR